MAAGRTALAALALLLVPTVAPACIAPAHTIGQMPETAVTLAYERDRVGIRGAWFDGPTTRYAHGALGDLVEATHLLAYSDSSVNSCETIVASAGDEHVFEDEAPRLADLDGDGRLEVIVVRTHQRLGAQLAIYGDARDGESLRLLATTPYIGRSNRWLAPIGAADLDGDGMMEIAYIDRPHLDRVLRVWRFRPDGAGGGDLVEVAAVQGLTNHVNRTPHIQGGIRDCGAGPEMITADTDWSRVVATTFRDGVLASRSLGRFREGALDAALDCS